MVLSVNGGDRVSYTFDEIDESGNATSTNNKKNFYVVDDEVSKAIETIRNYIKDNKLGE